MSLIVSRIVGNRVIFMGDTKLTFPYFDKKHPKDGVVKITIISPQICIAFAGEVENADKALKEIGQEQSKEKIVETLLKHPINSVQQTDFIICSGKPQLELLEIKHGQVKSTTTTWIGSQNAFNNFQKYLHSPELLINNIKDVAVFKLTPTPFDSTDEVKDLYSRMFEAMNGVIEDDSIPEVGGFVIPVIFEQGRFEYLPYTHSYRRPIVIDKTFPKNTSVSIGWENTEQGGYCINFIGSTKSKIAIHFHQGNLGVLYQRKAEGLLYPTIVPEKDEIDFIQEIKNDPDFRIGFTMKSNSIDYALKGKTKLDAGHFNEAIDYYDKAVIISSRDWENPRNSANNFKNLTDFIKIKGKYIIKEDDANNLKLIFYQRGLAKMGLAKMGLNDTSGALDDFDQSLKIDDGFILVLEEKSDLLLHLERYGDAIEALTKCIAINSHENYLFNRGYCHYKNNSLYQALSDISEAFKLDPHSKDIYHLLLEVTVKVSQIK